MADSMMKKRNVWIPLVLLFINFIFTGFLIEELIDASEPNYGMVALFTPVIGLISFIYIIKLAGKKPTFLFTVLQCFNLVFIILPIIVIIYGIILMVNY